MSDDAPDDPGHYCPDCGYDLRGIQSLRCPECGLKIDPLAVTSRIAWANRKHIGRIRAFWRTLIGATFSPKALAGAAAGPVEFRSGQIFRWTVVLLASIPIAALLLGVFAWLGGTNVVNLLGDNPLQNITFGAAGSWLWGFSWEMAFLWSAGATLWPILPLGICFSFFLATAAARFWFAASPLTATLRQRAVAMSEYACAPLAWMILPLLALTGALTVQEQPNNTFIGTLTLLSFAYFIGFVLILFAWWWSTLRLLSRTTHCSAGRLLAAGVLVPVGWIFCAAIGLAVFPALAGLLWLMFDSLR